MQVYALRILERDWPRKDWPHRNNIVFLFESHATTIISVLYDMQKVRISNIDL